MFHWWSSPILIALRTISDRLMLSFIAMTSMARVSSGGQSNVTRDQSRRLAHAREARRGRLGR